MWDLGIFPSGAVTKVKQKKNSFRVLPDFADALEFKLHGKFLCFSASVDSAAAADNEDNC